MLGIAILSLMFVNKTMKKTTLLIVILFSIVSFRSVAAVDQSENQDVYTKFVQGWNLYSQPVVTRSQPIMASDLIKSMDSQGGLVSTISRYEGGQYQDYVLRTNGEAYGNDFPIEIGKAYWILNYKEFTYHINGLPVSSWHMQLMSGFNFVGVPSVKSTSNISGLAQKIGKGVEPEISRFISGLFETYAIKQGQSYGQDFQFDKFHGYIIRVTNPVDLDIK